ncbi:MAG: hypothetical protein KDB69_07495, partial [Acidimicrobiia bacterium]|nr:hypothetical protein [Acidimicrobiia bacterium]
AATLAPTLFSCPAEAAVCADYWQGTRWVGKVETNRATDIAFTPDHAFIVGRTATTGGTSVIVLDRSVFPPAPIWESPPQELNHLSLSGNYLYVTDFALGLLVYDVSTPTAPVAIGSYPLLYAWDVFVEGDIAYVTTKHNPSSFVVLDVSDPTMPTHLGSIGLSAAGMGLDVDGDLAVVALGGNGFSVVDVSVPTQPMHLVTTPLPFDVALDVALEGDVACIAGRPSGSILANGGVVLVDLSTPSHPVIRSKLDGYVQSIARLGDVMAFLGMRVDAYSRRIDGAHFFDISDPANPEPLVDCPGRRASDSDRAVFDGPHLYVTAHTIEMIETAGFQGPREEAFTPVVSGLHGFSASGTLGACALSGFLWIYDLSGTFPAPRGSVPGERFDVVLDGTTLLTTTSTSLEIFDVSDPDAPDLVGSVVLPLSPDLIEWEAPFAYVYGEGISVVDCSDLTQPALIQTVTSAVVNADLDVVGDRAFSTGGYFESFDTWVRTFDLFDRNPNGTLSHITRGGDISSAYLSLDAGLRYLGDDILLTTGNFASCIDVSNPASLVVCSTAPLPTTGRQVTLSPNGDPYVACDLGFLVRIDAA